MRRFPRILAFAGTIGVTAAIVPVPAVALSAPDTLSATSAVGDLEGRGPVIEASFPVGHLGLSWLGDPHPHPDVRFRTGGVWGPWTEVHEDEIQTSGGRTWSALVPAWGADAYQVRGDAPDVRAYEINTTDGPRRLEWEQPEAQASHIAQPPLITRPLWGADESIRFKTNGTEKGLRTFYPTQKLIVHHTVTANNDPDPAATVRAIYEYHVQSRGFVDIAYNFLIDAQGQIYKGRYSGPQNTTDQDTTTGEDPQGRGVTGAHTGGFNSGTMGLAILGTYTSTPTTAATQAALVEHLAWEAERHLLDPMATTTFTNPASGETNTAGNISGHRDWGSTECPGGSLYAQLPTIRQQVAARVGQLAAPTDTKAPRIKKVEARKVKGQSAIIRWRTSEPATGTVQFWTKGGKRRTTPPEKVARKAHKIRLKGLKRETEYRFLVTGQDSAGNTGHSRRREFATPD
jgi:hypothetical protein